MRIFPGFDTTSVAQEKVEFIPFLSRFCPTFVPLFSHPSPVLFRHGCRRATFPKGEGYEGTDSRPSPIFGPRQSPAKRVCWGEEEQGSGRRATNGSPNRSGLWDDEKVPPEGNGGFRGSWRPPGPLGAGGAPGGAPGSGRGGGRCGGGGEFPPAGVRPGPPERRCGRLPAGKSCG